MYAPVVYTKFIIRIGLGVACVCACMYKYVCMCLSVCMHMLLITILCMCVVMPITVSIIYSVGITIRFGLLFISECLSCSLSGYSAHPFILVLSTVWLQEACAPSFYYYDMYV